MSAVTSFDTSTGTAGYMLMPGTEQKQGKADTAIDKSSSGRTFSIESARQKIEDAEPEHFRVIELAKQILCAQCIESAQKRQAALKQQFWLTGSTADCSRFEGFHPLSDEQITDLKRTDFERLYQWMPSFHGQQWKLFTLADLKKIDFSSKLRITPDKQTIIMLGHIISRL